MSKLEIRPGLDITIQTVPGSGWIRFWLPDTQPVSFNPEDSSFRYLEDSPPLEEVLNSVSPQDLARVVRRLLQYRRKRRRWIARHNSGAAQDDHPLGDAFLLHLPERAGLGDLPRDNTVLVRLPFERPENFWFVKAFNPDGLKTKFADNLAANSKLRDQLEKLKTKPFHIVAQSRDGTHAESGYGVECDEETARKLGRRFGQKTVIQFTDLGAWLVDCASGDRVTLDERNDLFLDPKKNKHFILFVGSPKGCVTIDDKIREAIRSCVAVWFDNFAIQKADGSFRSWPEESVLIHIATRKPRHAIEAAHDLRILLEQDGVGISQNGVYQRVREDSDTEEILDSFDICDPDPPYKTYAAPPLEND